MEELFINKQSSPFISGWLAYFCSPLLSIHTTMLNDIILIDKKHQAAATTLYDTMKLDLHPKYIVAISGEVGTGKCEVAHALGRLLINEGIAVKLLQMDDYYQVAPLERTYWRKQNGLHSIGFDEYDVKAIEGTIADFRESKPSVIPLVDLFTQQVDHLHTDFKGIEVLIISGLFSIQLKEPDLKVFIEMTYEETWDEQLHTQKEKIDSFRIEVLKQEHRAVQSIKHEAGFFIDFNTSLESFHL